MSASVREELDEFSSKLKVAQKQVDGRLLSTVPVANRPMENSKISLLKVTSIKWLFSKIGKAFSRVCGRLQLEATEPNRWGSQISKVHSNQVNRLNLTIEFGFQISNWALEHCGEQRLWFNDPTGQAGRLKPNRSNLCGSLEPKLFKFNFSEIISARKFPISIAILERIDNTDWKLKVFFRLKRRHKVFNFRKLNSRELFSIFRTASGTSAELKLEVTLGVSLEVMREWTRIVKTHLVERFVCYSRFEQQKLLKKSNRLTSPGMPSGDPVESAFFWPTNFSLLVQTCTEDCAEPAALCQSYWSVKFVGFTLGLQHFLKLLQQIELKRGYSDEWTSLAVLDF